MNTNMIITRARSILLSPRAEWPVIAAEPDTISGIYSGYIAVMAAIPAMMHFISFSLIGVSVPLAGDYRVAVGPGITSAILMYVVALVSVYVVAMVVNALAPTFGAGKNPVQALKSVAYAYTAGWVASIIGVIPGFTILAALAGAIYGIYLLWVGLPFTMKCPHDKAAGYTAVTIIVAIVLAVVLNLVIGSVVGPGMR